MEIDTNPYRRLSAEITPMEFEKFCLETLKAYAEKESLKGFEIRHNQKVETYDGTYQIDVLAEYTALGCRNTVVVAMLSGLSLQSCMQRFKALERRRAS